MSLQRCMKSMHSHVYGKGKLIEDGDKVITINHRLKSPHICKTRLLQTQDVQKNKVCEVFNSLD